VPVDPVPVVGFVAMTAQYVAGELIARRLYSPTAV
jgi:hypothetical protein